jgi:hypothetical protein
MTASAIDQLLAEVATMDLEALRALWRQHYGAPPALRSVPLMQLQLAWRLQADMLGGLDGATRKALGRTGPVEPEGKALGIGAVLSRNWQGRVIDVVVEQDGFRWNGTLFPSLSAAATAIAGSRWNGPRFFGLRNAA